MKKIDLKKWNFKKEKTESKESQSTTKSTPKRKIDGKRLGITILMVIVGLCVVVGICSLVYLKITIDKAPAFKTDDFINVESTKILDASGEVIGDVGMVNRENVSYDEIPQAFIDAMISVEDSRFFEHNGFDLPRFVKSMLENLRTLSFSQGASTLTMQLVRNVYFTDDATQTSRVKSIEYKIQQIYLAIEAEQQLSKKRIFELFVNRINFGASTTRGIKGAAQYYFGKEVSELTLSECAYLAGVINAPNGFNAYKNYEKGENRRNVVLDLMVRHGYISKTECELAKSISLADQLVGTSTSSNKYQAYINEVVDEVMALTNKDPYTTTMTIYTYMNKDVQDTIEAIQNGDTKIQFPDDLMQTAILSMNNQTGAIVGIGGGRGSIVAKGFSRVTDMYKQPGSSVKPFLSYALAFEYLGWATTQTLEDKPVAYRGTNIQIKNFDGTYSGEVLLTYAVGVSLNIPAYLTLEKVVDTVGSAKVIEYLNSLGFTQITKDTFDIGYSIGGSSFEVTVEQMAAAHSVLVNGGNYVTPHTVSRIEFADGSDPYVPTYASTRVLSEEAAYLASSLMEQNVSTNYGNYMQILNRSYDVYAKTGTTNYDDSFVDYGIPNGAAKDKWMIASTSEYTTAVWIGYDSAVDGADTFISSKKSALNIPGKINSMILDVLAEDHTPSNISRPDDIVSITHIKGVYPYASPLEGMNPDMIVTGLINRKNYSLTQLSLPNVSALTSFTANVKNVANGKMTLTLNWTSYPDPTQLTLNDGTYDISTDIGGKHVSATGKKLYDPTWVFGVVKYKASITGITDPISVSESQTDITIDLPADGSAPIKACGYYAYESGGAKSNEICQDVTMDVQVPNFTTIEEVQKFMTNYGLTNWTLLSSPATSTNLGTIAVTSGTDPRNQTIGYATLKSTPVTFTYFTVTVTSGDIDTKEHAEQFKSAWGLGSSWHITEVERTSASQVIGSLSNANPTPVGKVFATASELSTFACTLSYYKASSVEITIPATVAELMTALSSYGIPVTNAATTENITSVSFGGLTPKVPGEKFSVEEVFTSGNSVLIQ